jgi:hypothetical protein
MRPLLYFVLAVVLGLPAQVGACGSIVPSVCTDAPADPAPVRKVLTVKPTVTPFQIGDRFPVESQSFLMDPRRYDLKPSDGSWRYYAMNGIVYRVANGSGLVLEVIRTSRTAHLR